MLPYKCMLRQGETGANGQRAFILRYLLFGSSLICKSNHVARCQERTFILFTIFIQHTLSSYSSVGLRGIASRAARRALGCQAGCHWREDSLQVAQDGGQGLAQTNPYHSWQWPAPYTSPFCTSPFVSSQTCKTKLQPIRRRQQCLFGWQLHKRSTGIWPGRFEDCNSDAVLMSPRGEM